MGALVTLAVGLVVLGLALFAEAGVVTIPAGSRAASICTALGADDDCHTVEVAHLRALVTLVAYDDADTMLPVFAVVTCHGRTVALPLSPAHEATFTAELDDPTTDYRDLVIAQVAWPALRELADVPAGIGVLRDASRLRQRALVSTDPARAESRALRVRIALVTLAE